MTLKKRPFGAVAALLLGFCLNSKWRTSENDNAVQEHIQKIDEGVIIDGINKNTVTLTNGIIIYTKPEEEIYLKWNNTQNCWQYRTLTYYKERPTASDNIYEINNLQIFRNKKYKKYEDDKTNEGFCYLQLEDWGNIKNIEDFHNYIINYDTHKNLLPHTVLQLIKKMLDIQCTIKKERFTSINLTHIVNRGHFGVIIPPFVIDFTNNKMICVFNERSESDTEEYTSYFKFNDISGILTSHKDSYQNKAKELFEYVFNGNQIAKDIAKANECKKYLITEEEYKLIYDRLTNIIADKINQILEFVYPYIDIRLSTQKKTMRIRDNMWHI